MSGKNKILLPLLYFVISLLIGVKSFAQESDSFSVDTDLDGLTDKSETEIYKTDPKVADTDNDNVLDAQEIIDNTDPNNPSDNKIEFYKNQARTPIPRDVPIMWYIGRISGIASFIMFTLVICMGLMMTSKFLLKFRLLSPSGALETHSFNATFIALSLVIVHIVSFMFDDVIQLTLKEALIPFILERDITSPLGWTLNITISLGIIAFYLAIILVFTSRFRKKIVPLKVWRLIHYSSFAFYVTFLAHAYFGGSDSTEPWMKAIYLTSITLVSTLIFLRIFGKKYFLPKPVVPPAQTTNQISNV